MPYNPKTNWTPQDAPGPSDFNRIEQGIADATVAAEEAQAAADAAQETADTALSTAQAAQNTANTASQAISSHASAAAPHSGHAKLASENTFTARQTFAAGIQDGDANADVSFLYSLGIPMHSRSLVVTAWSPKGTPTQFQIKNGSTVMATITLTLNAKEKPTKAVALFNTPGGGTVTVEVTQTFENNTKFVSRTRTVTQA